MPVRGCLGQLWPGLHGVLLLLFAADPTDSAGCSAVSSPTAVCSVRGALSVRQHAYGKLRRRSCRYLYLACLLPSARMRRPRERPTPAVRTTDRALDDGCHSSSQIPFARAQTARHSTPTLNGGGFWALTRLPEADGSIPARE